jgi:hypothetical protein
LAEARKASQAERAQARTAAVAHEQEIVSTAQEAARKQLVEARGKLDIALASERTRLAAHANALGREIAEKVLGRGLAS